MLRQHQPRLQAASVLTEMTVATKIKQRQTRTMAQVLMLG